MWIVLYLKSVFAVVEEKDNTCKDRLSSCRIRIDALLESWDDILG